MSWVKLLQSPSKRHLWEADTERARVDVQSSAGAPAANVGDSPVLSGRGIPWGYMQSPTVLGLTSTRGPTSGNAYVRQRPYVPQRPLLPGLRTAKPHLSIWLPQLPPPSWVGLKGEDGVTITGNSAVIPASTRPGGTLLFAPQSVTSVFANLGACQWSLGLKS